MVVCGPVLFVVVDAVGNKGDSYRALDDGLGSFSIDDVQCSDQFVCRFLQLKQGLMCACGIDIFRVCVSVTEPLRSDCTLNHC